MKTRRLKYGFCFLLICCLTGCDDYAQKPIDNIIYVNHLELSMFVDDTIQLFASPTGGTHQYSWSSEDPNVATVSSNGLVEVIAEGFTNIIVSNGDISTKVPITAVVRIAVEDVVLSETSLALHVGDQKSILVSYIPENANDIPAYFWSTEDPEVATVNEIGKITAISEGITNIVYNISDIEKKIKVNVTDTIEVPDTGDGKIIRNLTLLR